MKNKCLTGLLLLLFSVSAYANLKSVEIEVPSGEVITLSRAGNAGDHFLWLPSEYGARARVREHIEALGAMGQTASLAELHDSYFVPPGRSSLGKFPLPDLAALIEASLPTGHGKLFIISSGRGAVLAVLAIRQWLASSEHADKLGGVILLHPNFQAGSAASHEAVRYLSLIDQIALPLFIIQPDKSSKFYYLGGLTERLQKAGSQVYAQLVENVSDGYQARDDTSETERSQAALLPAQIKNAARLLAATRMKVAVGEVGDSPWVTEKLPDTLQAYAETISAPDLHLTDTTGRSWNLQQLRGKTVVLNFWASWCPPCVEEIPSLGRLQEKFSKDELLVLSVDVGESQATVEAFLKRVPSKFPVMLDPEGSVVKAWKIRAFPTTFVIDKQGRLSLFYFGGLEWDRVDIVAQLRSLLASPPVKPPPTGS